MPVLSWKRVGERPQEDRWTSREAARKDPSLGEYAPPETEAPRRGAAGGRAGLFETCANPGCRSGWLQLWRSRKAPVFEGGWSCSPECTQARLTAALYREMDGRGRAPEGHTHRIPLGLVMLKQGWINHGQLRRALEAQKAAGGGRLGSWLVRREGVSEHLVTRALGLQWSCPVLPLDFYDSSSLAVFLPRLFVDAFGALPLRVAAGKVLYLGFEDRLDPALALGVERMTGLRVESGIVDGSRFRPAQEQMLTAAFPPVELIEAVSEPMLARALGRALERAHAVESRLVRVHDLVWLRMWLRPQSAPLPEAAGVADVIGSVGTA